MSKTTEVKPVFSDYLAFLFAFLFSLIYFIQNFSSIWISHDAYLIFLGSMIAIGISTTVVGKIFFYFVFEWRNPNV